MTHVPQNTALPPVVEVASLSAFVLAAGAGERVALGRLFAQRRFTQIYVRCSRGSLAASAGGRERIVGPGEVLVWEPSVALRIESAPARVLAVCSVERREGIGPAVFRAPSEVCSAFDDVEVAWSARGEVGFERRLQELLGALGMGVSRDETARSAIAHAARASMGVPAGETLTIPRMAEACGTSPTVLKESFRAEFGLPVYEWSRRLRMVRAADLLGSGAYSVGEVAKLVGYSNASKFSRAFSDCVGVAPSVYRRA